MSAQKRQRRAEAHHTFVTMGESMLRFQPIDDAEVTSATRHMPQPFLRSVGGDELNVSVALSLLGVQAKWISVVPKGPLGDVLTESCKHHGVTFAGERVDGEVGIFTVLPEEGTVHYQRRQSAFALHDPKTLHWPSLLKTGGLPWLHVTGITPLISAPSRESWDAAIVEASALSIPISLDLNHRKQLGTLVELWAMVEPHLKCFELVILSLDQLVGLAELHNVDATALGAGGKDPSDEQCLRVMRELRAKTPLSDSKRVTLCRKTRRPDGVQRRWSLMVDASGATFSTHDLPIWHAPRDECGGGSAWAAGFVEECDRHGVLAVPSAFTSNECWALHRRGVRLIKLFHAGLASPAILKSMLDVGATLPGGFGSNLNIMPSGGVSPANAAAWLDAGALIVGMGSNLVGKDISTTPGTEVHEKAVGEWTDKGKATARTLFQQMDARFASLGHACQQ